MSCSKFPHRPQSLKTPALATPSKLSHGYPSNALVTTHNTLESVVSFAYWCHVGLKGVAVPLNAR